MTDAEKKLTYPEAFSLALIAALAAIGASIVTNLGQHALAKDQFQRSERADAYAAFAGASKDLLRAERNASLLFASNQAIPTQESGQDEIDALGDVNVRLQTAAAMVRIAGPSEVSDASEAVVKHLGSLSEVHFEGFATLGTKPTPSQIAAVKSQADPMSTGITNSKMASWKLPSPLWDLDRTSCARSRGYVATGTTSRSACLNQAGCALSPLGLGHVY